MDGGIQPTYNLADRGYGDGYGFGGSGLWLFAILALMWGGNGFFGNRGYGLDGRFATVEDLNNSANFTRLESQVMNNGNRIESKTDAIINGLSDLGYESAQQFGTLGRQLAECCCTTQRAIDAVQYTNALNTASINANTTAQVQKVLDTLCADKAAAQAQRISQLELQQALAGVVRYPTAMAYTAGFSPFCNGCGCSGYTNI